MAHTGPKDVNNSALFGPGCPLSALVHAKAKLGINSVHKKKERRVYYLPAAAVTKKSDYLTL
jgi:hypothetical protein